MSRRCHGNDRNLLPCGLGDIWDLLRREPTVAANGEKQIWQKLIQN